jgi:hypothetical protein
LGRPEESPHDLAEFVLRGGLRTAAAVHRSARAALLVNKLAFVLRKPAEGCFKQLLAVEHFVLDAVVAEKCVDTLRAQEVQAVRDVLDTGAALPFLLETVTFRDLSFEFGDAVGSFLCELFPFALLGASLLFGGLRFALRLAAVLFALRGLPLQALAFRGLVVESCAELFDRLVTVGVVSVWVVLSLLVSWVPVSAPVSVAVSCVSSSATKGSPW